MYKLLKVKDVVRIPPTMFTMDPKDAAKLVLRETYEGIYDREEGVILAVMDVEEIGQGGRGAGRRSDLPRGCL